MFEADKYLIIALTSYLISFYGTSLLIPVLKKLNFIDVVSSRRIHAVPTPRGGGLAISFSFFFCLSFIYLFPLWPAISGNLQYDWWISTLPAAGLLLIVGLLDDLKGLPWKLKLLGQAVSALLLFDAGISLGSIAATSLTPAVDLALTVVWVLAFINAFNLIDGLDGLASGLAMIAGLGLALSSAFRSQPLDALVLVAFVGSCTGFLRHNFHPAKIFLGDTGSMFLGFVLAAVSLTTTTKATVVTAIGMPLLAIGIPVLDTLLAIWRRSVRAASSADSGLAKADLEHLHHRLLARGLTQRRTALLLYTINGFFVLVGLASVAFSSQALSILLIAFVLGSYVIFKHLAHIELWDSTQLALKGLRRPSKSALASLAYPLMDIVILGAVWALTTFVSNVNGLNNISWKEAIRTIAPFWVGTAFSFLVISKTYSRVWSRARISELTGTAVWLGCGAIVAFSLVRIAFPDRLLLPGVNFMLLFSTLSMLCICGIRALPRTVEDWASLSFHEVRNKAPRTLIYGAGLQGLMLLRVLGTSRCPVTVQPIGFIDDDRNLRKRLISNLEVMGNGAELFDIVKKAEVRLLVLACPLREEVEREICLMAKQSNLKVFKWTTSLQALHLGEESTTPILQPGQMTGT